MKRRFCVILLLMAVLFLCACAYADETEYDLYVGGVRVTSANCRKIVGDGISDGGNLAFDPSTNTLSIANKTLDSYYSKPAGSGAYAEYAGYNYYGIYSELPELTINIYGTSVINSCISARNLTIKGSGTLTVNARTGSSGCPGISCGTLTILPESILKVDGSAGAYGRTGLELAGKLDVQGALEVTVEKGKPACAVSSYGKSLNVDISGRVRLTASCPMNVTNGAFGLMAGEGEVKVSGTLEIDVAKTGGDNSTGISCASLTLEKDADIVISSAGSAIETKKLTAPGTIKLLAGESAEEYAPADVSAEALQVPCLRLSKWRNNDPGSAFPIQVNTEISDEISSADESDYYRFTLPSAGVVRLSFDCDGEHETGDWIVKVGTEEEIKEQKSYHGPIFTGKLLDGFTGADESANLGLPAGTWYVRIQPGNSYCALPYRLTVHFTPADNWETESNDNWKSGNPVAFDTTVSGALVRNSNKYYCTPADWFRFTAPEDGYLTVKFTYEKTDSDVIYRDLSVYHEESLNKATWWMPVKDNSQSVYICEWIQIPAGECAFTVGAHTYGNGAICYQETDYSFSLHFIPRSMVCEISFDCGDGEGSMDSVLVQKGEKYILPECEMKGPEGRNFIRWDAGAPGEEITVSDNLTLTARWKWPEIVPAPLFERKGLVLPKGITCIEENAFEGTNAVSVYIPDGCLSIGAKAFADCRELGSVRIPESVVRIDDSAFAGDGAILIYGKTEKEAGQNEAQRIAELYGYQFVEEITDPDAGDSVSP